MPALHDVSDLCDAQRHEPLNRTPWSGAAARTAIQRICTSAEHALDDTQGSWPSHPRDDPPGPCARSFNVYRGAAGTAESQVKVPAGGGSTTLTYRVNSRF